ncbi:hypothetical protein S96127_1538 [Yersinia pestis]|nr:hypothetical protein S96127_1538 [Yersinia pestis]
MTCFVTTRFVMVYGVMAYSVMIICPI